MVKRHAFGYRVAVTLVHKVSNHMVVIFGDNPINEYDYLDCFKGRSEKQEMKNMKLDNWNTNVAKTQAWMLNELDDEPTRVALEATIALGNNCENDEARSTFWTAIRSIGSPHEGFPKARVGQPSLLSSEGQVNVANAKNLVTSAFATIGEHADEETIMAVLKVIVPHGRTGGEYESWSAYCDYMGERAEDYMMKAVKENRWDAEEDISKIVPLPTKAERDAMANTEEAVTEE